MIAYVGMDAIGHIEGRRTTGQVFHLAFWGKYENLLLEDIAFHRLHKLVCILRQFTLPLAQLLYPRNHFARREAGCSAVLHVTVTGASLNSETVHLLPPGHYLLQLLI